MQHFFVLLSLYGAFTLTFALVSLFIKECLYISETVMATLFGIVIGPKGFNILAIEDYPTILFYLSRMVISLQVVAVGILVPRNYVKEYCRSLFMLLVPIMFLTYIISSVLTYFMAGVGLYASMIVGACVTPTDPVLASSVLKGRFANRYIPRHLRYLLTLESGLNDGLGFPLLTLPLFLMTNSLKSAMSKWVVHTWLYEVFFAVFLGLVIGFVAKKLLVASYRLNLIDKENFLAYLLALAFVVTGITGLLKSDDILASFFCGMIFAWDGQYKDKIKGSSLYEVLDLMINASFFILFGASFTSHIRYLPLAILIILLRRLPVILLSRRLIPHLFNLRESFFAGWYGPIGVGALFFITHARECMSAVPIDNALVHIVNMVVLCSVLIHGTTAPIIHVSMNEHKVGPNAYLTESECDENEVSRCKKCDMLCACEMDGKGISYGYKDIYDDD